jgi:hypothetical protein
MATRAKKVLAGIAAFAALAFGGAAIAQAGGTQATQPASPAASQPAEPGGESTAPENSAADPDNVQDQSGSDQETADGQSDQETADGPQGSEAPEGAEVPGGDGPGGHADEPSNPNANNQSQSQG